MSNENPSNSQSKPEKQRLNFNELYGEVMTPPPRPKKKPQPPEEPQSQNSDRSEEN